MTSASPTSLSPSVEHVRLDVWLWATRFFKTRALAKAALAAGRVDVNDIAAKPSRTLHVGDRLRIARNEERFEVEVTVLIDRRVGAPQAAHCYREDEASRAAREEAAAQRRLAIAGYARPATKPDKRARRLIIALGDIDAM